MKTTAVYLKHILMFSLMLLIVNIVAAQDYQIKHEVQRGETLSSIAKQYGLTEQMIKDANPQMGNLFYVGLKLNIPKKGEAKNETKKEKVEDYDGIVDVSSNNTHSTLSNRGVMNGNINYDAEGVDNYFVYQPDAKVYGLDISMDMYKYFFWGMSFYSNLKFKENQLFGQVNINLGVKKRIVFEDRFMVSFKLYPYIGGVSPSGDADSDFTYGAAGTVNVGFKLFDTSKGKTVFLSGGYNVMANEFKTKGIFDSGCWMLGITFVSK